MHIFMAVSSWLMPASSVTFSPTLVRTSLGTPAFTHAATSSGLALAPPNSMPARTPLSTARVSMLARDVLHDDVSNMSSRPHVNPRICKNAVKSLPSRVSSFSEKVGPYKSNTACTRPYDDAPNAFLSSTPTTKSFSCTMTVPSSGADPQSFPAIFALALRLKGVRPMRRWWRTAEIACFPVQSMWGFKIAGGGSTMELRGFTSKQLAYSSCCRVARVKNVSFMVSRTPVMRWSWMSPRSGSPLGPMYW
mmetsp:Transcript_9879/g.24663  ORF Transcript_9879/g.24663 Transcript_9879/m.24663 type:complete len:249 (+) Transcript_9879:266-1012(+)